MAFFLSKFLPLFIYPAGVTVLLLLAALLCWRRKNLSRGLVLAALLVVYFAGNRWVSMALVHSLESQYPPVESLKKSDVIVILGGGTDPAQTPRPMVEVNGAGDRVLYGLKLYRDGVSDRLLLSGGSVNWQGMRQYSPAEDMAFLLELMGVPKEKLVLQTESLNTFEDAQFSAKIITENGWENVILVTSALHMPRSVKLFAEAGITVTPAPVDFTVSDQEWSELFSWEAENILINLLPTSANLRSTTSSMKEYIGMLVNSFSDEQ